MVGQAELLMVCMAKQVWAQNLRNRAAIYFIDTDAARYGLIPGSSRVDASTTLVFHAWRTDAELAALSWYARVPTRSNIADGPSRLEFSILLAWPFSQVVAPVFPECRVLFGES